MKIFKWLGIALLLFLAGWGAGNWFSSSLSVESCTADTNRLMEEIRCNNLIASLYLTGEQKAALIDLGEQAQKIRAVNVKVVRQTNPELRKTLEDIYAQVKRDPLVKGEAGAEYLRLISKIENSALWENDELNRLTGKACRLLSANQKFMVRDYIPCIVPTCNLSKPERAGEADKIGKESGWMDRLMRAPLRDYPQAKKQVLEEARRELLGLNMKPDWVDLQLNRLSRVMDEARRLTPEEYSLRRKALAEKGKIVYKYVGERGIFPQPAPGEGIHEPGAPDRPQRARLQDDKLEVNVRNYLLSREALKVLKSR